MKNLLLIIGILFTNLLFSQAFTVTSYCVDEAPLEANTCDIYGEEYSLLTIDLETNSVTLFFMEMEFSYEIVSHKWNEEKNYFEYNMLDVLGVKIKLYSTKNRARHLIAYPSSTLTLATELNP